MSGGTRWAALFPWQGSQTVGMGRALAETWPEAAEVFRTADEVLGEPLSKLIFEGPDSDLRLTRNTQPALLTVSIAAWRVLEKRVPQPIVGAGHSLGEYSALTAAGVLKLEDALRAVRLRGDAMQDAVPPGEGAMAAIIGLDAAAVEELCREAAGDEVLVPANFNAPDQIVIAGSAGAVERFMQLAPGRGAKRCVPLPVSAPFHSPLMRPAAERLANFLAGVEFHEGRFPIVANVDAQPVMGGEASRERLIKQVAAPVRWVEGSRKLEEDHAATMGVEIGPGRVLTGLSRRINDRLKVAPFFEPEDLEKTIARLAAEGEAAAKESA